MAEVEAFYDSSGHFSDPKTPCITLAGYAATPDYWVVFNEKFKQALDGDGTRPVARYLRMSELNALGGESSYRKGWNETHTKALLGDVISKCLSPLGWVEHERKFHGAACTVNRDDYNKAKTALPHLAGPEHICVNRVVRVALRMLEEDPTTPTHKTGQAHLYFDQNEPYEKEIYREWEDPDKRSPVMKLISGIDRIDMRTSYPMQAADYLAWLTNRKWASGSEEANIRRILSAPMMAEYYGYDTLLRDFSSLTNIWHLRWGG